MQKSCIKMRRVDYSFASTSNDGERFRSMFPDSQIAKHFKQGETKTKYTIQYSIYPYFKDFFARRFEKYCLHI